MEFLYLVGWEPGKFRPRRHEENKVVIKGTVKEWEDFLVEIYDPRRFKWWEDRLLGKIAEGKKKNEGHWNACRERYGERFIEE